MSVTFGPELGRLFSAKAKLGTRTSDISDHYRNFDLGTDLGLLYSFQDMAIDFRYNYGLTNLSHHTFIDVFGNEIGKTNSGANRVFEFSFCYYIK